MELGLVPVMALLRRFSSPLGKPTATIVLEHFTAILAEELLGNRAVLQGAHPTMAGLWRWHAYEEIEHKAVAFDVYRQVSGGGGLGAYLRRCGMIVVMSVLFWLNALMISTHLLRHDGKAGDVRGWLGLFRFLSFSPAVFRRVQRSYWALVSPLLPSLEAGLPPPAQGVGSAEPIHPGDGNSDKLTSHRSGSEQERSEV